MKIHNKRKFVTAVIATTISIACLIVYFTTNREPRFILAFFLALVYAGFACYSALSKSMPLDELKLNTDERDVFIAMKTSQATLLILNRLLLSACIISILFYAVFRSPFCIAVIITLCSISIALFVIQLLTNLYFEKHN